jgi:hypothetical protein
MLSTPMSDGTDEKIGGRSGNTSRAALVIYCGRFFKILGF